MLSQFTPVSTLPTADLAGARGFYEDTLGMTQRRDVMGGVLYGSGDGTIYLYESRYAGTNKATALSLNVPLSEFDAEVDHLRAKGVSFMTFDLGDTEWKDGVASMGESMRAVWFTDPDGNILNVSAGVL
jgi:catechol 2,3-dioxygenase-like lactoylglutathione lyase family enzyme